MPIVEEPFHGGADRARDDGASPPFVLSLSRRRDLIIVRS
jgi:hypothetical protein